MQTAYSKAWSGFKKTEHYKDISAMLKKLGVKNPYCDNIIRNIYDEGWSASRMFLMTKVKEDV